MREASARAGLSQAELDRTLDRLQPRLASLRDAYATGALPLLRVPKRRDDIAPARDALAALSKDATTLVFFGTGGSSLGGQTLAQLGGWGIPGDDGNGGQRGRPRTRFYDNLDARTLERALASLDLATTRFVVISKSGNTPETLIQTIAAIEAVRAAGLGDRIPELFLGLTEPRSKATNGLRDLCEALSIPTLPHDPGIGGRFSGLTNVGLLPALARGLDVEALREGAHSVIEGLLTVTTPKDFAPAIGAAVAVGLAKEHGVKVSVMLPYADRLSRFAAWYVQLWGESLGKNGEGTTPVAALGPVDQHSQLQLYLDGAPQHVITVVREACAGTGPRSHRRSRQARQRRVSRRPYRRRSRRRPAKGHPRDLDRGRPPGPHHRPRAARRARAWRPDDAFHAGNDPRRASLGRRPVRPASGRIG